MENTELEAGRTYDPISIAEKATVATAFAAAVSMTEADITKRSDELIGDLARAYEQSDHGKDWSKAEGFGTGDEIPVAIMRTHSEYAGYQKAMAERKRKAAEVEAPKNTLPVPGGYSGGPVSVFSACMAQAAKDGVATTKELVSRALNLSYRATATHGMTLAQVHYAAKMAATIPAPSVYMPGVTPDAARVAATVYDLIPKVQSDDGDIKYFEETVFTNAAAPQGANNALVADSTLGVEEQTVVMRRIAHRLPLTESQLQNSSFAQSYVDMAMPSMVIQAVDNQIVSGDGSGQNLTGLMHIAGSQNYVFAKGTGGGANRIDPADVLAKLYKAVIAFGKGTNLMARPSHVIAHPDFFGELTGSTNDNGFFYGSPQIAFVPMAWGLPMVQSMRLDGVANGNTAGLLVDFVTAMYIVLIERGGLESAIGYSGTDFAQYKLTARASQYCGLMVRFPEAVMTLKVAA